MKNEKCFAWYVMWARKLSHRYEISGAKKHNNGNLKTEFMTPKNELITRKKQLIYQKNLNANQILTFLEFIF
jgi:hypothetical protein